MWKTVAVTAAVVAMIGCSNDNRIVIKNDAESMLLINFRATEYDIASGQGTTIKGIPNGTYDYVTTFSIPREATSLSVSGGAGSGSLTFSKQNTHQLLLYSSTVFDSVYSVFVNATSSDHPAAAKITGPR